MIIFKRVFKLQSGHEYALKSIEGEITQKVLNRELIAISPKPIGRGIKNNEKNSRLSSAAVVIGAKG